MGLLKFIYGQTEGPPPATLEVGGVDGEPIRIASYDYNAAIAVLKPEDE